MSDEHAGEGVVCVQCGETLAPDARFCGACGAPAGGIGSSMAPPPSPSPSPPPGPAMPPPPAPGAVVPPPPPVAATNSSRVVGIVVGVVLLVLLLPVLAIIAIQVLGNEAETKFRSTGSTINAPLYDGDGGVVLPDPIVLEG